MIFKPEEYKRAIENEFTIINKDKLEVPFVLNKAQDHFVKNLTERNIILKARKMGFSSVLLAIASLKFLLGKNERCVSMSFDADASGKQLERAKHFIDSFSRKNGGELKPKYNSKTELVLETTDPETGSKYVNSLRIGTAQSDSFGRGDDITFLHITEVAMCPHLDQLLAGVTQAVVNNAIVTYETTANGFNDFKRFWDESELGQTGFKPFFYGPEWEYSPEFLAQKQKELGKLFKQEYPATALEAFLTSGDNYFNSEALENYLRSAKDPIMEGLVYV